MPHPKAAAHTLREPAQSKCTSTCHLGHFLHTCTRKMPQPKTTAQPLREPAQSKCTSTCHESQFIRKFTGKVQQPKTTAHTLCEPAWSKRMPRFFNAEIYRKMLQPRLSPERRHTQSEHPDQAPACTLTVRTPQCRHNVWRKMHVFQIHNMLKILWRARLWP